MEIVTEIFNKIRSSYNRVNLSIDFRNFSNNMWKNEFSLYYNGWSIAYGKETWFIKSFEFNESIQKIVSSIEEDKNNLLALIQSYPPNNDEKNSIQNSLSTALKEIKDKQEYLESFWDKKMKEDDPFDEEEGIPSPYYEYYELLNDKTPEILKIHTAQIDLLQNCIYELEDSIAPNVNDLDITERCLIIYLLIEVGKFPTYNPSKNTTKQNLIDFLSILMNENPKSIDTAYDKMETLIKGKGLSPKQIPPRISQLEKVKPYFELIKEEDVIQIINKRLEQLKESLG